MAYATTMQRVEARRLPWSEVLTAGATAGLAGGLLMLFFAMAQAALVGAGVFYPLRLVGATFDGPLALVSGPITVLAGLGLHLLLAMSLGALFAALVERHTTAGAALIGGTAFALSALLIMTLVVVPVANPTMVPRIATMPGSWFVQHVLFGVGLAAAPALRRRLAPAEEIR